MVTLPYLNSQLANQRPAISPDTLRYQVTDLIWLQCHAHFAEFDYCNT